MKIPSRCDECSFSVFFDNPPFSRKPHWSCSLIFHILGDEHDVNPHTVDSLCPLQQKKFTEFLQEYAALFAEKEGFKFPIEIDYMKD